MCHRILCDFIEMLNLPSFKKLVGYNFNPENEIKSYKKSIIYNSNL